MKLGKLLKGAVSIVDKVALGGILKNKSTDTADSPKGKVDVKDLIIGGVVSLCCLAFVYLLITGKITFAQFIEGVESVKEVTD